MNQFCKNLLNYYRLKLTGLKYTASHIMTLYSFSESAFRPRVDFGGLMTNN
jgi:hypothetical protein